MSDLNASTHLYLNGKHVGSVADRIGRAHADSGWSFGDFTPAEAFAEFAPLFGRWSLLMHAEDDSDRISPPAAEELRQVEVALDSIHARLHYPATGQWQDLSQVNIDGTLIEWKIV